LFALASAKILFLSILIAFSSLSSYAIFESCSTESFRAALDFCWNSLKSMAIESLSTVILSRSDLIILSSLANLALSFDSFLAFETDWSPPSKLMFELNSLLEI